jgi:hypothetical protein
MCDPLTLAERARGRRPQFEILPRTTSIGLGSWDWTSPDGGRLVHLPCSREARANLRLKDGSAWDAEPRGHSHQVGKGIGLHLLHYVAPVGFHCYLADTEFPTNTFIQQARDHQRHNLNIHDREGMRTGFGVAACPPCVAEPRGCGKVS